MWRFACPISIAALAVCSLSAGCSPFRPPATLHDLAEAYVRITLQLAQHRPTLVDAWLGAAAWRPGPRLPVADLRVTLDELVARVNTIKPEDLDPTEAPRLTYLRGQLAALTLVTRRLLGDSTRFADEVRLAFGRPIPEPDTALAARARDALDQELKGPGSLADRYSGFRRQFVIVEERVDRVLAAAIDACRDATAPHVTLPADQRIDVEFDPAVEWDAYTQYLGDHHTRMRMASRRGHDVAGLLHLACHETYSGHHLQHVLIDDALVKGRGWTEFQLTPAFGPHLLISEGAAETAVDLALPESVRVVIYRDRLLPLAGLPTAEAARLARVETLAAALDGDVPRLVSSFLDNEASAEATAAALQTSGLMPAPERFLAFAERHRTAAVVYPIGKAAVGQWVAQASTDAERWRRLQDIFTLRPFSLE